MLQFLKHIGEVKMAKLANAVESKTLITSLKDGAYKQAVSNDLIVSFAKFVLETCPSFPDSIPEEISAQLNEGYRLRYAEKNKPVQYAVVRDHYIVATEDHASYEKVNIGSEYALSFTQQQFGKMKSENPYLYETIKPIRKAVQTYCSNRIKDLARQVRLLKKPEGSNTRSATKDFGDRINDVLDDLKTKCKTAHERGDLTADRTKLQDAINAFNKVWTK